MSLSCCISVDLFSGLFNRCDTTQCCCPCCCSPFRARYKQLVDRIYPANHHDGLVKTNMEKLVFYALSSPEKLDRIGAYLAERTSRDLSRHRIGFVVISIEAMDQLLVSCHSLNLFVPSYLKVVQLLLESQDTELQVLATQSFVKFANIKEDTPSYHRSYDFFVCKFSSLCHSNISELKKRKQLRVAGLVGIKGLIRKTVSDDLQVDIWNETHMEKIVPSLLFNMQCKDFEEMQDSEENQKGLSDNADARSCDSSVAFPSIISEECLRELIARATFGHVSSIMKPLIKHFDLHKLWEATIVPTSDKFAIKTFKIIMYSIQPQFSYTVVQILMNHLDSITSDRNGDSSIEHKIRVRTGIVTVLNEIITTSVSESIGPSVLRIVNSLLQHLHDSINSVNVRKSVAEEEKLFQEAVMNTLGAFTTNLPDFQKIEIMIFIIDKAPPSSAISTTDIQLQNIILKSLLKVTTKYKPVSMMQTFPNALLTQLLSRALAHDPRVRLTVQKIFHQLLDRHANLQRLLKPVTMKSPEPVTIEKADRYDLSFIKRHGHEILVNLYNNIQLTNNNQENFNSIFTTLALICIEMNSDELVIDLLRLIFAIQELASFKSSSLSESHRSYIHCLVAGFLRLFSQLKAIPAICAHVEQVIQTRAKQAPHLLPEFSHQINSLHLRRSSIQSQPMSAAATTKASTTTNNNKSNEATTLSSRQGSLENLISDELLFNKNVFTEALQNTGHDISALSTPFLSNSDVDSSMTRSISDLNAITLDIDSVNSSPGVGRKLPEQEITFSTFKDIITNSQSDRIEESRRRTNLLNQFKKNRFEDLVDHHYGNSNGDENLYIKLLSTINRSFATMENNNNQTVISGQPISVNASDNARQSSHQVDSFNRTLPLNSPLKRINNGDSSWLQLDSTGKYNSTTTQEGGQHDLTEMMSSWHIYDNPLLSICDVNKINSRGPPLFALRFPQLFVY